MAAIEQELIERISKLDKDSQNQVLAFVRNLSRPPEISGDDLIARAHQVNFDPVDLAEMQRAIDEGCERIELEAGDKARHPGDA